MRFQSRIGCPPHGVRRRVDWTIHRPAAGRLHLDIASGRRRVVVPGVSLCPAVGFTAVAGIWLAYGIVLRQGPIVLSSILWVILDLVIVSGVLRFGGL